MKPDNELNRPAGTQYVDQGVQPTAPALRGVLEELKKREPIFHHPEHGTRRLDLENMIAEEFFEVGASGRRYSRQYVLDTLERRQASPQAEVWETHDFHCLLIAPDNYLLTYTLDQGARITRRATIWRHCEGAWKIVYHQGTTLENS